MSYKTQSSFATGELDPALYERTDLEKYRAGLMTCRNTLIGKSGRLISRPGTGWYMTTKYPDRDSVLYSPPYSQYVIEWGDLYVRIHNTVTMSFTEDTHDWTAAQVTNLHFVPAGKFFVYIFCTGFLVKKMYTGAIDPTTPPFDVRFQTSDQIFLLDQPIDGASAIITGTGYQVDYAITYMKDGLESDWFLLNDATYLLPQNAGEYNKITIDFPFQVPIFPHVGDYSHFTSVNVYRKPTNGAAFGFIGSAPGIPTPTPLHTPVVGTCVFFDYGGAADYTHSPPASIPIALPIEDHDNPIERVTSKTGCIYQQRLLVTDDGNTEAIYGSRTGFQNSFFEESTLTPDSAIAFKSGTSGSANVLRMWDSVNGLLVFTTIGVFQNIGGLDYTNLSLNRLSTAVIQDNIPPLDVPGGSIIVDKTTNSIQSLIFSYAEQSFPPDELSIYSAHLFRGRTVVSWAFQDGDIPIIWIVMDDGSLLSLTYKREQMMRAWSHSDSSNAKFECVTVLKDVNNQSIAYFQVNRASVRSIEAMAPRYATFINNGGVVNLNDIKQYIGMDACVSFTENLGAAAGGATLNIFAHDVNHWDGPLDLISNFSMFVNSPGQGAIGDVFRFFDNQGSAVDLVVTQLVNDAHVVVQPSVMFPYDQTVNVTVYGTFNVLTGLDHLNGKFVSILLDGYVIASPNNDIENYDQYLVANGMITLNNGLRGAFIHVGLPFTSDVQTLDVDTVEEKPVLLESIIVHKVFMRVLNTRGLYVGPVFPDNDQVDGMTDPETIPEDPILGVTGNRAQPLVSKRYDIVCPNDWQVHGRICIRQVDPLPFEILSIIPDLEVVA